jgi:hypothetical protein
VCAAGDGGFGKGGGPTAGSGEASADNSSRKPLSTAVTAVAEEMSAEASTSASLAVSAQSASSFKKKKPGLGLSISTNSERDYSNIPSDMRVFMASQSNVIEKSARRVPSKKPAGLTIDASSVGRQPMDGGGGLGLNLEMDPTSRRIAGYGAGENYESTRQARIAAEKQSDTTVRVGDFKIRASGISLADENSRRIPRAPGAAGVAEARAEKNVNAMLVALGGSFNFVEIGALGAGASGTVVEALHIPTLTIVALKMLPCYNQAKRASIESELAVLCKSCTL